MRNPNFHRWDPTPIPDISVRRTPEQRRCRWVYPDGHVCGRGDGGFDHVASIIPDLPEEPQP